MMEMEHEEETRENEKEERKTEKGDEEEMNMERQKMTQSTDTRKIGEERRQKIRVCNGTKSCWKKVFRESKLIIDAG